MNKKPTFVFRLSLIASLDLTVILLFLLSVLVVWGTLFQVEHGIYAAQERFFNAWFTTIGGIIPFPAVKTLVTLLSVNLIAQLVHRRKLTIKTAGIYIIHIGVMLLVAGSAISSRLVKESTLTLNKGQSAREAYDFTSWDFVIMERVGTTAKQNSISFEHLRKGKSISLATTDASLKISKIYKNCSAKVDRNDRTVIGELNTLPPDNKNGRNIPGASFTINGQEGTLSKDTVHVWAGVERSAVYRISNTTVAASILPRRVALPFKISLETFDVKWHPGTEKAKSYRSTVRVLGKNIDRDIVIEMNRPFRYGAYTFYQMSYSGTEGNYSTSLAVVYNPIRYMPYVASIIVVVGLLMHFLVKMSASLSSIKGSYRE